MNSIEMDERVFESFRRVIYQSSGIALRDNKLQLVKARIRKRMLELGFTKGRDYLNYVEADESETEMVHLLDAIATNVTSFFREDRHFEVIASWIRHKVFEEGRTRLRFWSAACSSGEEPLTLAMIIDQAVGDRPLDWKILGTDISAKILVRAQQGLYPATKVQPIPHHLRQRYFQSETHDGEVFYRAKRDLMRRIVYRRVNLSAPPFPLKGPLDIVMCRNVMIYFDDDVRRKLLSDIYRLVAQDGLLLVGHAESLTGMLSDFVSLMPSVYAKQRGNLPDILRKPLPPAGAA